MLFPGCDSEEAPDCFKTAGGTSTRTLGVDPFEELIVYGNIKVYIQQGPGQKLVVETGQNLMDGISAEVENGRLSLRNRNNCPVFREYHQTMVHLTIPDLSLVWNAGNLPVESVGVLAFPKISLVSINPDNDPEIYTNGDFRLDLFSDEVRVKGDHYSNFFLKGETEALEVELLSGDGRVEAGDLVAGKVQLQHRGTNRIIIYPQHELRGEIRSTGDVLSINRPPVVEVEEFYTGRLIFE